MIRPADGLVVYTGKGSASARLSAFRNKRSSKNMAVVKVAERSADVQWTGTLREGGGTLNAGSGALQDLPVTWASRAEQPDGKTSPEELLASAHATCYAMAL